MSTSDENTPNPVKYRALHVDCFSGASEDSLFSACMDIASEQLAHDIESMLHSGMPDLEFDLVVLDKKVSIMKAKQVHVDMEGEESFSLKQVCQLLATSDSTYIPSKVRGHALDVFGELAAAEDTVFERDAEFSSKTIVLVVGIFLVLDKLKVGTVSCGSLPLGEGTMQTRDGLLPIPSPMTLQLLLGMPTCPGPPGVLSRDLVSPTAAAILRVLTEKRYSKLSPFVTREIGVGVDNHGCIMRLQLGDVIDANQNGDRTVTESSVRFNDDDGLDLPSPKWKMDRLVHLEANLDDMTAEALAFATELLMENGAIDAWVAPIVMKKGRAAHTLHCLCHSNGSYEMRLVETIFRHTTTLGIRIHRNVDRAALRRSFVSVQTPFSKDDVKVKIGYYGDEVVSVKAEYEDCASISRESGIPIKEITDYAQLQTLSQLDSS